MSEILLFISTYPFHVVTGCPISISELGLDYHFPLCMAQKHRKGVMNKVTSYTGSFTLGWLCAGGSWWSRTQPNAGWLACELSVLRSTGPVHQSGWGFGQTRGVAAIRVQIQSNLTGCTGSRYSHLWLFGAFSCTSKKKSGKRCWARVIRIVKRDLCKKYEVIPVTCIASFIKARKDGITLVSYNLY